MREILNRPHEEVGARNCFKAKDSATGADRGTCRFSKTFLIERRRALARAARKIGGISCWSAVKPGRIWRPMMASCGFAEPANTI